MMSLIRTVKKACVVGFTLLLLPTLFLVALVSTIARSLVALLAKISRPDLAGLMYGIGVGFAVESLYHKPLTIIVAHFVISGTVSVTTLREKFCQRVLPGPDDMGTASSRTQPSPESFASLTHRWTTFMGYVFWQRDSDFQVENHIRPYDYDGPDLTLPPLATDKDLERVTAALLALPFVEGRSPWEILVVPKYRSSWNTEGREQSVMILRIHHTLADGQSIFNLLLRLMDQEHLKLPAPRFSKKTWIGKIGSSLLVFAKFPIDFVVKRWIQWDDPNCWSPRCHRPSHRYRTFFSGPVRVADVKEIMKRHSVCFNAAIYSITVGAMVKVMEETGQKVPEKLAAFYPYPLPSQHPKGLCNHVSGDVFTFHPRARPKAALRLKEIARSVQPASVPNISPIWWEWLGQTCLRLPAKLIASVSTLQSVSGFTLTVTSFPGPVSEIDACGTGKIVEILTAMMSSNTNLVCAVMYSVAGTLRITLSLDSVVLPQQDVQIGFERYVQEEIEELLMSASCKEDEKFSKYVQQAEVKDGRLGDADIPLTTVHIEP